MGIYLTPKYGLVWIYFYTISFFGFFVLGTKLNTGFKLKILLEPFSSLSVVHAHVCALVLLSFVLTSTAGFIVQVGPSNLASFLEVLVFGVKFFANLVLMRALLLMGFYGVHATRGDLIFALLVYWTIPTLVWGFLQFMGLSKKSTTFFARVFPSTAGRVSKALRFARDHGYFEAVIAASAVGTLGISTSKYYEDSKLANAIRNGENPTPTSSPTQNKGLGSQKSIFFSFFYFFSY